MFADENSLEDMDQAIKAGSFIRLKGTTTIDRFDGELSIGSVRGIKKYEDYPAPLPKRKGRIYDVYNWCRFIYILYP